MAYRKKKEKGKRKEGRKEGKEEKKRTEKLLWAGYLAPYSTPAPHSQQLLRLCMAFGCGQNYTDSIPIVENIIL